MEEVILAHLVAGGRRALTQLLAAAASNTNAYHMPVQGLARRPESASSQEMFFFLRQCVREDRS